MLIDSSYFIGERNIAQLQTQAIQDSVDLFIEKREPEYLEMALGYAFAKLFADGLGVDPTEQRWTDLLEGAEYENCKGHLKKWKGLTNDDKISPIANYIYWYYMRDNVTYSTSVGESEGKSENSSVASSVPKSVSAWNEMVDQTRLMYDFLLNKKDEAGALVYDEFDIEQVDCYLTKKTNVFGL